MTALRMSDGYHEHTTAVDMLAAAGINPPQEWAELRTRWADAAESDGTSALDRYADAIVTGGTDDDLILLHALALAEAAANTQHQAAVRNAVQHRVLRKLHSVYATASTANYGKVAALFNKSAAAFTKTAAIVDPETPAEQLVTADERARKAWVDALLLARELDALLPTLQAAARLAGVHTNTPEATLALTVNTEGLHRRKTWQAFDSTGRCGRWSAIVALGATITAAALDSFTPYRKPKPIEEHWRQVSRGQQQRYMVDPEDAEQQAAQQAAQPA